MTVPQYQAPQLSDKSKVVAGLLQLVPGFLFGLGGIGRLYAGQTALGIIQLVATVVGWSAFWCGFFLAFPFFLFGAIWLWFVIDGIVLLAVGEVSLGGSGGQRARRDSSLTAGRPVDGQGRPLRS